VDDSDELLGARLDAALRADLGSDRVDVATLLVGSHRRARRLRTQRMVTMTAAAVLVVAIPVSYQVLDPHPTGIAPPAAMLPSGSGSAVPRTAAPSAHPAPTPVVTPTPGNDRKSGRLSTATRPARSSTPEATDSLRFKRALLIPDWFAFSAAELPSGLVLARTGPIIDDRIVEGQACGRPPTWSPESVAGRQWRWQAKGAGADARVVTLTVTTWAEDRAAIAFQAALTDFKGCGWFGRQTTLSDQSGGSDDERWDATSTLAGRNYGRALIRVGDAIVGIQVSDPDGLDSAAELTADLAAGQNDRLQRFAKSEADTLGSIAATSFSSD
jgi:hypothetical protein